MPYKDIVERREYLKEYKRKARRAAGIRPRVRLTDKQRKKRKQECTNKWKKENRKRYTKSATVAHRKWRLNLRRKVVDLYGGSCACCGERTFEFLAIDHINGRGTKHIRSFSNYTNYLSWLVSRKRAGFRILCHNCNQARSRWGQCPHGKGI